MNEFLNNLKRQAEENPIVALGVGAVLITAVSKLLDANTARSNSRAWSKEVDRRMMNTRK